MKDLLDKLIDGQDLSESEARSLLDEMTDPKLDQIMAASALTALRMKGETAEEVRGFALRLREIAIRPETPLDAQAVDIVGTGGDASGSLNLSTGAALLAAAAGVPVIKHGNRSISSKSGSADVLEELGLSIPLDPSEAGDLFERTGFTFLFAPAYHPAMKSIAPVRRSLGLRTIFNIAGPLANPATPPLHVIGAYSVAMAEIMAETLAGMPIERAYVVHGESGWDEPTPIGPYHLFEVSDGSVRSSMEDPADFGMSRCGPADLAGASAAYNAAEIVKVFEGERGPHRDALVLGASLASRVTGVPADRSVADIESAIGDGRARTLLRSLVSVDV